MELTFEQYERVQKYLDGKMTPREEKLFMEELDSNIAMKEHLAFEKELREQLFIMQMEKGFTGTVTPGNEGAEDDDMKNRIAETGKNWKQKQNKNPLRSVTGDEDDSKVITMPLDKRKRWYMAAAACAVIVIAGIAIWLSSGPRKVDPIVDGNDTLNKKQNIIIKDPADTGSHKEKVLPDRGGANYASIVKKYYKKDDAPFPEDVPQYLRKSLSDYNDDDYSSITKTDLIDPPVARGNDDELQTIKELGHYYKGLAFIETKENKKAIENLGWVVDSAKNETLQVKGQWYLGLVYLDTGNPKTGTSLLMKVQNNKIEKEYKTKAAIILKELGKE